MTTKLDQHQDAANEARLRYKYRRIVASGKVKLPIRLAKKLAGPDCAYHLYAQHLPADKTAKE